MEPGKSRDSRFRTSINLNLGQAAARRISTPNPPITAPSPIVPRTQRADAMASRRLALNLQQSMRSRSAISAVKSSRQSPLTRGLATPISYGAKTESTTLKNGFTVCHTRCDPSGLQLTPVCRLLPSTPRGPRLRPSVCGSTQEAAQRRTRPMELHTSWSILLSRYGHAAGSQWQCGATGMLM